MLKHMKAFFLVAVLALSGCASTGLQINTFNDRVGVAIAAVTSVRETTTNLALAKKITVEDKVNVEKQADTAREGISLAVKLHKTDTGAGVSKLAAAEVILTGLTNYLATKQVK